MQGTAHLPFAPATSFPLMRYRDRTEAGEALARALLHLHEQDVLVLALPRGGVPVAAPVAAALDAELDVIVARKLGAPLQPEFGFGAIAPGARYLDEGTVRMLGLTRDDVAEVEAGERDEMHRRIQQYRGARRPPRVAGRVVVLVDDGVATGGTARAALRSLRAQSPARLVFAAPVGPPEARVELAPEADEVMLLETPSDFQAVGKWYRDFGQTSDEEVLAHLRESRVREVAVDVGRETLRGTLAVPPGAKGLVVFAHGSGSSRFSPRNRAVARTLREHGLATLLVDLLTPDEEQRDERTRELRFDIPLLAERVEAIVSWTRREERLRALPVGLFGSSTGAAAALVAASKLPDVVRAVVSRGGRPDLAHDALPRVRCPTLLLVGRLDEQVIALNEEAAGRMTCPLELSIVDGASHLFEEPGTLDEAARQAAEFLVRVLTAGEARVPM